MQKIKKTYFIVRVLVCYALAPFIWPFLFVICGIFVIYRKIIDVILRTKLGNKYGGLLDVADSIMIRDDGNKYVITSVLIIESDIERDIFHLIKERIKNKVFDCPHDYPKLTSTLHVFCGYPYWIKNDYKLDNCLGVISIPDNTDFDEEFLKNMVAELISKPFPKNDTAVWNMAVCQNPLKNIKKDELFYYPIIARFNHAIADGTSLIDFLIRVIGEEHVNNYSQNIFKKLLDQSARSNNCSSLSYKLLDFLKRNVIFLMWWFYIVFIGLGKVLKMTQIRADDHNALHGPELCGKKIAAWHVENNIKHIPIVKEIKCIVPKTKFSDIIMTAVSASLTNFFKRKSQPIPEMFTTVMTTLLYFPPSDRTKPVRLENKTTLLIFELPSHKSNSLVELLEDVKKQSEDNNFGDLLINQLLISKIAGIFPIDIAKKILGPGLQTALITNIPGSPQVPILDGCVVNKVIPLAPNVTKVGVTISILSYDEKFQLGILVDKAILSSQSEVQKIADDIFYHIKLLHAETKKVYNND